jgi:uncharacterized membrane protein
MKYSDRPRLIIEASDADKLIDIISITMLASAFVYLSMNYSALPDRIATHFDGSGHPDGWGSKETIWFLPALGALLFFGLRFLYNIPHRFNYLVEITADNAEKQYRLAVNMIRYLNLAIAIIFSVIVISMIQIALNRADGLSPLFMVLIVLLIFLPSVYFIYKSLLNR